MTGPLRDFKSTSPSVSPFLEVKVDEKSRNDVLREILIVGGADSLESLTYEDGNLEIDL